MGPETGTSLDAGKGADEVEHDTLGLNFSLHKC